MFTIPGKVLKSIDYFVCLLFILLLLLTCEKSTTPLEPLSAQYTSHNYEWEIDTLDAPGAWQTSMLDIWGTDENNVYVVGHSDDSRYIAYHWDGIVWTPIDLRLLGHPASLSEIHGFSATDIWAVGYEVHGYPVISHEDFIVHYNGNQWNLIENVNAPWCFSVWGTSSNNLFVGSDSGIIIHYNGTSWIKKYTNSPTRILSIYGLNENIIYATGVAPDNRSPDDSISYYFYKYENGQWEIANSAVRTIALEPFEFGYSDIWGQKGIIYSGGYGLYQFLGNQWKRIFDDNIFIWSIHGNNINDIFAVGLFGYIFHYNGVEWHQYLQFMERFIFNAGVWMYGDYVFIIGQPDNYSVILRGKRHKGNGSP